MKRIETDATVSAFRKMVDYDYVKTVLEDCRLYSDSKLEYLRT